MPTSSPTPTEKPSPKPSPTFIPLSLLREDLQTIIFTTNSEQGPQIWRVQIDEQGQKDGVAEQINFSVNSQTHIENLYPSPNSQQVAVVWSYGDSGANFVHILNIANGQLTPLFGTKTNIHPAVTFLDWEPNRNHILVLGIRGNPDLGNSVWRLILKPTHIMI